MQSTIQKIISVILCMALLCSMLAFVGTAEENEMDAKDYPYIYLDNHDLKCSILVVSYDLLFTKLGGEPTISVSYRQTQTEGEAVEPNAEECILRIDPQSIRRELFPDSENKVHPQLFIRLPGYIGTGDAQIPPSAKLTISANAYQSADGVPSPAVELQFSQFANRKIGVCFYSEKVTLSHHILVNTEIAVAMNYHFSDYISLWHQNAAFYLDDVPITTKDGKDRWCATVPDEGNHAVRMQLNDFVFTKELNFYAISRWEARKTQFSELGITGITSGMANMLISIPLIIAPGIAIPNFFGGMLSIGEGLGCLFLSTFLLYLHSDWFYNDGSASRNVKYGALLYDSSHWVFS